MIKLPALILALTLALPTHSHSQSLDVDIPITIHANYTVTFTAPPPTSTQVTALQFTLTFIPYRVASTSVTPGPAATTASKTVQCGPLNITLGFITCIVSGLNQTAISTGVVAEFASTFHKRAPNSDNITVTCIVASDANGNAVPIPNPLPCNNAVAAFNVDCTTTVFTLPQPTAANVVITQNALVIPATAYTVMQGVITFATAPTCPVCQCVACEPCPPCPGLNVTYTY